MKEWAMTMVNQYFASVPDVKITDIVEIIIIAVIVYEIALWIKNTKAWMLLRGIIVLIVFISVAAIFRMNTILWLVRNSISVLAIAANRCLPTGASKGFGEAWGERLSEISRRF